MYKYAQRFDYMDTRTDNHFFFFLAYGKIGTGICYDIRCGRYSHVLEIEGGNVLTLNSLQVPGISYDCSAKGLYCYDLSWSLQYYNRTHALGIVAACTVSF